MTRLSRLATFLVLTAAAAACSKPKVETAPAPTPAEAAAQTQDSLNRVVVAQREATDRAAAAAAAAAAERQRQLDVPAQRERARVDSIANIAASRDRMMAEARNTLGSRIYFDFEQDALTDQSKATLDAKLPLLNANPGLKIRILGHCDERGSDEYNMALGQRRAAAAKRYLTQHGIDASRIEIVSFGEERAIVQGHDESAWSQNRRDEFEITAGGDALMLPR